MISLVFPYMDVSFGTVAVDTLSTDYKEINKKQE
jgi:hypothetical protein